MISDNELALATQEGDSLAFGELYDRYVRQIHDFLYYRTFHKETAEDLASTTFLKAYKSIHRYNIKKNGSFSSWLYRIARNTLIDHYRTHKRTSDLDAITEPKDPQNIERQTQARLTLEEAKAYLTTLPQETQDILTLRLWQQMSYKEIAEVMGKTEASCKMQVSRSLRSMKETVLLSLILLPHLL